MRKISLYIVIFFFLFTYLVAAQTIKPTYGTNILIKLAKNEYFKGDLESSITFYRYLIGMDPQDPTPYLNIAAIYKEKGDIQKSINCLHEGLMINPTNPALRLELAKIHLQIGDGVNANNLLGNVEDRDILFYKALALIQQKRWEDAKPLLKRVIVIDNQFTLGQFFLGLCNLETGYANEAITALQKAVQMERSFTGINVLLGDLFYKAGEYSKSYNAYSNSPANLLNKEMEEQIVALKGILNISDEEVKDKPLGDKVVNYRKVTPLKGPKMPNLRVALLPKSSRLAFQAGSKFTLRREKDNEIIFSGPGSQSFILKATAKGVDLFDVQNNFVASFKEKIKLILDDETTTLALFDVEYGQGYFWAGIEDRQYRGDFIINPTLDGFFQFINEVSIEEYLLSTVPSEMPASWPLNALKAQAIAARSYTLLKLKSSQNKDYDVVESVANAVYKGVTWENNNSTNAVKETIGVVAVYDDQIINAVFSSNSGGHTEDASFVWGGSIPYLQGVNLEVEDSSFPHTPYSLDQWVRNWEPTYSMPNSYGSSASYRWSRVLYPNEPPVARQVGRILEIIPITRGLGGSINEVKVVGEKSETIIKGDSIRSQLGGLKNNRFIVEPFYLDKPIPEFFLVWGGGWGHNVGLDQTAAAEMAANSFSHSEILKYFYEGISLEKIY